MNELKRLESSDLAPLSTHTIGLGTLTTGLELGEAGAMPGTDSYEAERMVDELRKKKADQPSYVPTRHLVYIFIFFIMASIWGAILDFTTKGKLSKSEYISSEKSSERIAKMNRESIMEAKKYKRPFPSDFQKENIQKYAHLYNESTPLNDIFKHNLIRDDNYPDGYAAIAYRKYARNPNTYENDFCQLALNVSWHIHWFEPDPKYKFWKGNVFSYAGDPRPELVQCDMTNWHEYKSGHDLRINIIIAICALGTLLSTFYACRSIRRAGI